MTQIPVNNKFKDKEIQTNSLLFKFNKMAKSTRSTSVTPKTKKAYKLSSPQNTKLSIEEIKDLIFKQESVIAEQQNTLKMHLIIKNVIKPLNDFMIKANQTISCKFLTKT